MERIKFIALYFVSVTFQLQVSFGLNVGNSARDSSTFNSPECGRRINEIRGERLNKIVGGQQADPEDWGWQALLEHLGSFSCGGSLINREWVISAAHCIRIPINPSNYNIKLGVHNRLSPESYSTSRSVSEIIIHPSYDDVTEENDIALVKLSSPVDYTDQVLPVCLPSRNYDFTNQMSWATGWGSLTSGGFPSNILMEVEIPILSESDCRLKYFQSNNLLINTTNSICAGENGQGKDTCQGDSGGPLVVKVGDKWQLAGITSWGFGCGDGGVYTKTSFYIDWILEFIPNPISLVSDSSENVFSQTQTENLESKSTNLIKENNTIFSKTTLKIRTDSFTDTTEFNKEVNTEKLTQEQSIFTSISSLSGRQDSFASTIEFSTEKAQNLSTLLKSTLIQSKESTSFQKTTVDQFNNSTIFEFSGFFQINDSESSSRLMSDHLRKSSIDQNLEPLYEKFRQILGASTEFRLIEISNGSYDLVIIVTKESETDSNFISTEISSITQKIEENKQELISTLPSSVKYSFETSKIKSSARQTMIENGVRIITECDQNSASEDISCVKTIVYSNGTIVNGTSFTLTRGTVESQDSNTEPNSNGISSSTSSSLSPPLLTSSASSNNHASFLTIKLISVFLFGSIQFVDFF